MATWVNAPMKTGKPYTPISTMRSRYSAMTFGIEARSSHLWERKRCHRGKRYARPNPGIGEGIKFQTEDLGG